MRTEVLENRPHHRMKKAVMIIAPHNFRDEEFLEPKAVLEQAGVNVTVASTTTDEAIGKLGAKVKPDTTIDKVRANDLDAVIFVGGAGCRIYWDDKLALTLAQDSYRSGKVTAAICDGSVILARSGILKDKRATVYSGSAEELKRAGAIYAAQPVEVDGNIITASGPAAAVDFGKALAEALKK